MYETSIPFTYSELYRTDNAVVHCTSLTSSKASLLLLSSTELERAFITAVPKIYYVLLNS